MGEVKRATFKSSIMGYVNADRDAVDEERMILCCAVCCLNLSFYPNCGLCSGKIGVCCLNAEVCCNPGAPCLPCCCCGPTCDGSGICNVQCQLGCCVVSGALPCTEEVPAAVTVLGCTLYPKCGPCMPMKKVMDR